MSDLEKIKKYYGEKMSHFCRDNFPTILETNGLLYDILSSHFAPNKFLYDDIKKQEKKIDFKNYIYYYFKREIEEVEVDKTPKELFDEAGYILYECKSENDIQSFKKYYAEDEELCTFNGGRLKNCYVFFAVKKDVDEIKREDYKNPMRQDRYGTSVISIQFTRGNVNTLSIKNRYNHTVDDPDATFSNDLENIMAGLTKSFEKVYNLKINSNKKSFELEGYTLANDYKFYKYNFEENNIYYCPNNIIVDNGNVITDYQEKEKYIIFENFIFDLRGKKIFCYNEKCIDKAFLKRVDGIEKIDIFLDKENNFKEITLKTINGNIKIKLDKNSKMISYYDDIKSDIDDNFLYWNKSLEEIDLPNVKVIGNMFMPNNIHLRNINIPNCEIIKDDFLKLNKTLEFILLPKVISIFNYFLYENQIISNIDLPKVEHIGNYFLQNCNDLIEFKAESLIDVGECFLQHCYYLKKIYVPNIINIGNDFLSANEDATEIIMPNVKKIGRSAFKYNEKAISIILPCVEDIGDRFFKYNNSLRKVIMPNVKYIGEEFLFDNVVLEELDMPGTVIAEYGFLDKHLEYSLNPYVINSSKFQY